MKYGVWIFCMLLLMMFNGSCNLVGGEQKEEEAILSTAPFAMISDSINRFPQNGDLYLRRAQLLSQKNYHQLAFSDYRKAWQLNQDEAAALAYASNLFISGREKEAIELLRQCVKKFPSNSEFSRRLSEAYVQSGRSSEALDEYNSILKNEPDNFEAFYEKGVLLAQSGDTAEAIAALEEAFRLQPLQLFGVTLANLYAETRNPKVLALCDKLIQGDSAKELTEAVFVKGLYFANVNEPALALEQFETCINRDWKFTEAYIEKGIILFESKNIDEALKTFALAAKVSNTYADAYYWMGRCYESIGNNEEARDNYSRALALDRNFPEAEIALERLK